MSITVRIPYYTDNLDVPQPWNEICARAIEMFGLPGDRFQTHVTTEHMDFVFNSNKDALMFAIEHNGQIVLNNDLTVEHIGKMFNV
jgi:putative lipase involved disintegration of autophagic bodies